MTKKKQPTQLIGKGLIFRYMMTAVTLRRSLPNIRNKRHFPKELWLFKIIHVLIMGQRPVIMVTMSNLSLKRLQLSSLIRRLEMGPM